MFVKLLIKSFKCTDMLYYVTLALQHYSINHLKPNQHFVYAHVTSSLFSKDLIILHLLILAS